MLIPVILFIIGLLCLIKGGDWFVDGASALARRFHLPELLIGQPQERYRIFLGVPFLYVGRKGIKHPFPQRPGGNLLLIVPLALPPDFPEGTGKAIGFAAVGKCQLQNVGCLSAAYWQRMEEKSPRTPPLLFP